MMDRLLRNSRIRLSQGQLFWREIGQGSTVIFLHGFWSDSSEWQPLLELLSVDYHCFAIDLLGFGESEHPDIHYSIAVEVECLAEYLETLNLKQVYLVGHCLGGWVASSFALKYQEQVGGIVLFAPEGLDADGGGKYPWWTKLLLKHPSRLFWLLRHLENIARYFGWQKRLKQIIRLSAELTKNLTACQLLFQRRQAEIQAELLQERLSLLRVPLLILQGEKDTASAISQSKEYAKLAPQAHLQIIDDAGEDLFKTQSDLVAEKIREFFSGLEMQR